MMQQDRCTHGNAIGPFKDCVVTTRIQSQKKTVSLQNHPSRPASNCTAARHFSTPMVVTILLFAANRELQDPCTHLADAFSDNVSHQAATVKVLNNKTISVRRSEDLLPLEKIRSVFLAYMRCRQCNHRRCHCDTVSE
jgi:hypothetical protein